MVTDIIGTPNLEETLRKSDLSKKEIDVIKHDINYFDEYYLTSDGKSVGVFQQEFRNDPYINARCITALKNAPLIRLIAYPHNVSIQEFNDIFNKKDVPIITRANGLTLDLFTDLGFKEIENIYGNPTVLLPIEFTIPQNLPSGIGKHIHQMSENDLNEIEELFKSEYSLRYRTVRS